MAQEYLARTKELRENFAKIAGSIPTTVEDISHEYPEQLKKVREQFTAILGGNYFLTSAIVKTAHERKVEVYFAYNISQQKKILRPYLKLVTDFNNGLILEFKNAYYSEFADTKKYPLNTEFNANVPVARTAKEQMELLNSLQALYVKVREFAFDKDLSNENRRILADYADCLSKTVPTDLLNFCKDTEPEFFDWITISLHPSR